VLARNLTPWTLPAAVAVVLTALGLTAGRAGPPEIPSVPPLPADRSEAAATSGPALPQEVAGQEPGVPKLGFVNSQYVFELHPQVPDIRRTFENQLEQWQRQQVEMEQRAEGLQNELRTAQLSPNQRRSKEAELRQLLEDLASFQTQLWSPGGRAETREQELMQPVIQAMDKVIQGIAEQEGYALIFDVTASGLLFGHQDLDLTRQVMLQLGITPSPPPGGGDS
jgi:outer membrane protein